MAAFETTLTVPTRHVHEIMTRLSKAGFTLLDTGDRISNDDGLDAEATLRLIHLGIPSLEEEGSFELGVSA
jgi:hypothetical protein